MDCPTYWAYAVFKFFNFLFARLYLFGFVDWSMLPAMIYGTISIGIFPIVGIGAIALTRQERKYKSIADEINEVNDPRINPIELKKNIRNIPINQIKYVESLQNYVKIGYVDDNGSIQVNTERATLKQLQEQAEGSQLVRCHRSFLVNKSSILSYSGNAQGLLLSLDNCDKVVPVSRSYVEAFRN